MGSHSGTFQRERRMKTMKRISPWCFLVVLWICIQAGYATEQEERPSDNLYEYRWAGKRSPLYQERLQGKRSDDPDDGYYGFNLLGKRIYDSRMNGKRLYDDRMVGKRLYDDRMVGKRLYDDRMIKRLYGDRVYGKRNGLYDYRMLN